MLCWWVLKSTFWRRDGTLRSELQSVFIYKRTTQLMRKTHNLWIQYSLWYLSMLVTRYSFFRLNLWADAVTRLNLLRILCTVHSTWSAEHDRFKQSISFHLISAIKIQLPAGADSRENTVYVKIRQNQRFCIVLNFIQRDITGSMNILRKTRWGVGASQNLTLRIKKGAWSVKKIEFFVFDRGCPRELKGLSFVRQQQKPRSHPSPTWPSERVFCHQFWSQSTELYFIWRI